MGVFVLSIATMEMTTRMIRITRKLALAASLTAVVVGVGTGVAFAAGDTDDSISPPNTAFTATNTTHGTTTNIVFQGTINGFPITVTCKNSTISATTPASGLGPITITVTFTNCTDSLGGTDTVTISTANGSWQLTFIDSTATGEETQTEPNSGDQIQVTIPKAGATFKSSALSSCTITVAPTAPATITGVYDDVNTVSFSGVSFPVSGAGCTATSSKITGSYKSNVNFHDVS